MRKRILSGLLVAVMVFSMVPTYAMAEESDGLGEGVTITNGYYNGTYYGEDGKPAEPPAKEKSVSEDAAPDEAAKSVDEGIQYFDASEMDDMDVLEAEPETDSDEPNAPEDVSDETESQEAEDVVETGKPAGAVPTKRPVESDERVEVPVDEALVEVVVPELKDPEPIPAMSNEELEAAQDAQLPELDMSELNMDEMELVTLFAEAEDNLDLGLGDVLLSGGGSYTITQSKGEGFVTGTNVTITDAEEYQLVFEGDINIDMRKSVLDANRVGKPGIDLVSGSKVTIQFNGATTIIGGACAAGVRVPSGAELTITGGTLTTTGGVSQNTDDSRKESGAGIGGNMLENCGKITILGGNIVAKGGSNTYSGAAGIGGGSAGTEEIRNPSDAHCSALEGIYILGGHVTAIASSSVSYGAAGIGGGSTGRAENIVIGGTDMAVTVIANAGETNITNGGAGIGGGCFGSGSRLHIGRNANVTSKAGDFVSNTGAGIGGGYQGDGFDLLFDGNCVVTTTQSDTQFMLAGAGIGGGANADGDNIRFNLDGGSITVTALNVESDAGAGIGGGAFGNGTNILIEGTGTIEANAIVTGAGIGGGSLGYAQHIYIRGCNVTATAGTASNATRTGAGIGGGTGSHPNADVIAPEVPSHGYRGWADDIQITGGNVTASALRGAAGIGGGYLGFGTNILISGEDSSNPTVVSASSAGDNEARQGAAGIGGGHNTYGANITLQGAVKVTAFGGYEAAGIGGGWHGVGVNLLFQDITTTGLGNMSAYGVYAGNIGSGGGVTEDKTLYGGLDENGDVEIIQVDYSKYADDPGLDGDAVVPANIYIVNSNVHCGNIGSNGRVFTWTWYGEDNIDNRLVYLYVPVTITGGRVYSGFVGSCGPFGAYTYWGCEEKYRVGGKDFNQSVPVVGERYTKVNVKIDNTVFDGAGVGTLSSTDMAIVNVDVRNCESFRSRNTVGLRTDCQNTDLTVNIRDCGTVDVSGAYAYGDYAGQARKLNTSSGSHFNASASNYYNSAVGIGIGPCCRNVMVNVSLSGCDTVMARGSTYNYSTYVTENDYRYKSVAFGVGYDSSDCIFVGTVNNIATGFYLTSGHCGSFVGFGGCNTRRGSIDIHVSNVKYIGRMNNDSYSSALMFGLCYSSDTEATICVSDVDEIVQYVTYVDNFSMVMGTHGCNGVDCHFTMEDVGSISTRNVTSTAWLGHGRAVFGSSRSEDSYVDVSVHNCGDITVDITSLSNGVVIGSSQDRNSRVKVSLISDEETSYLRPSLTVNSTLYDYGGTVIGTSNSYRDGSSVASSEVLISGFGDIVWTYGNPQQREWDYSGSVFIGSRYAHGHQNGTFVSDIRVEDCGNIRMLLKPGTGGPAILGIGDAYCGDSFDGNVTIERCGNIDLEMANVDASGNLVNLANTDCEANDFNVGIGCCNGYAANGLGFESDISLKDVGNIDIKLCHCSIGIGTCAMSVNSDNSSVQSNIDLEGCENITIHVSYGCTGIGVCGAFTSQYPNCGSSMVFTECGDVSILNYPNTGGQYCIGIGLGGTISYVNTNAYRDLSILFDRCGDINVSPCVNVDDSRDYYYDETTMGIGFMMSARNSAGKSSTVVIQNCGDIIALGSCRGPGIGYGYSANGPGGDLSVQLLNNKSVTAKSFKNSCWGNGVREGAAIGSVEALGSGDAKREIIISGSPVTATSGRAPAIGVGRNAQNGKLTIKLEDIPELTVKNKYGTVMGLGRDCSNVELDLTLDDVTMAGDEQSLVSKGYGAGIGTSMSCSNCRTILNLKDFVAPVIQGANGGAGVGCGPLNTMGNMTINITGGSMEAIGSASSENALEVLGTTGNTAQDLVMEKTILGAGAGIGGSDSSVLTYVNISGEYDEDGNLVSAPVIVAYGDAVNDAASAGIGGGSNNGAEIHIDGANVTAYGGGEGSDAGAAGIGSGSKKDGGTVELVDSVVTTYGGNGAKQGGAGIGSGGGSTTGGDVLVIGDCNIHAYGSDRGAGIGGGSRSDGANLSIYSRLDYFGEGHTRSPKIYAYSGLLDSSAIGGGAASPSETAAYIVIIDESQGASSFETPVEIYAYGYANREAIQADVRSICQPLVQGTIYEPVGTLNNELTGMEESVNSKAQIELVLNGQSVSDESVVFNSGEIPSGYSAFSMLLPYSVDGKTVNTYMHQTGWSDDHSQDTKMVQLVDEKEKFDLKEHTETKALSLTLVQYHPVTFVTTVPDGSEVVFNSKNPQFVRTNYTVEFPDIPVVSNGGWVFGGWFVDEDRTIPYDFTKSVNGPITLYADYLDGEGLPYEVHHYKQSVTNPDVYEQALTEVKLAPANRLVRAEYREFEGFDEVIKNDEANGNVTAVTGVIPEMKDGRLILRLYYDRKNYTVKLVNFDPIQGQPTELIGAYGSTVSLFIPSKQYYDFVGWTKADADGDNVATFIPVRIETLGDTLFANWEIREGAAYKVRYYLRGLDGNYTLRYTEDKAAIGEEMMKPVTATVYDYEGYELNHSISDETMTDTIREDGTTVLRVYYDLVDVYVKLNDTDLPDGADVVIREYGDIANLPTPSRAGYVFQGWFREDGIQVRSKATINDCGLNGTHAGTQADPYQVTALWTPVEQGVTYSVEYYTQNAKGEYVINMLERVVGQSGSEVSVEPRVMFGYTFNEEKSNTSSIVAGDGSTVLQLYYDIQSYTVHFDSNGGSSVSDADGVFFGGNVAEPSNPVKQGYVFDGWYMDSGLGVRFNFLQPISGETTLYAKWSNAKDTAYTVYHYVETTDGLGYILKDTDSLTGETDIVVYAQPRAYEGCVQNLAHPDSRTEGKVLPDGSLTLHVYYERKPVTVVYESLGGTDIPDQTFKFGGTADDLTPERAGYDFAGWYSNASLSKKFDFETMLRKDIVLWAKWTPRDDTPYKTEHWLQSAEDRDVYELVDTVESTGTTEKVVHAAVNIYDKFHQNEKYELSNLTEEIFGDGSTVLKVYYDRDDLVVKFDVDGGIAVADMSVPFEDVIGEVTTTKTGYVFGGWYADEGLTEAWGPEEPVLDDMTLHARWVPAEDTKYAIEHWLQNKAMDGYELAKEVDGTGTTDSVVHALPEAFYGFEENEAADGRVASAEVQPDGSTVLKLYYDRVRFTVDFDSNGGSKVDSVKAFYGKSVAEPTAPGKTGYVFQGWYTSSLYDEAFLFGETAVTSDMTLHAKWAPASGVKYTVEYYKETVAGKYEKAGYEEFAGTTGETVEAQVKMADGFTVNLDAEGTVKNGSVLADGSLVLKLFYDRNGHVVTFDPQNGGDAVTRDVKYGLAVGDGPKAEKTGYVLSGWKTDAGVELSEDYAMPDSDVTFHAVWTPGEVGYTVEHYKQTLNGGYDLVETDELTGVTGSVVSAGTKDYQGFHLATGGVVTGRVDADGRTVLKVYYDRKDYTVSFVTGNGTNIPSQTVSYESGIVAPEALAKTGCVFVGWYSDEAFEQKVNPDTLKVTSDMTLRAKWGPASDTRYVLQYWHQSVDRDGYFMAESVETKGVTDKIASIDAKAFHGFKENTGHALRVPEAGVRPDGSTVLRLYYDRLDWTVDFDANGGSQVESQAVVHEGTANRSADPKRTGYDFAGWYVDPIFSREFDFEASVTDDITLYAKWMPRGDTVYTVEYYQQNVIGDGYAKVSEETLLLAGDTEAEVFAPEKELVGFTLNCGHADAVMSGHVQPEGDLVLKVYYDRNQYKLTVDPRNGEAKTVSDVRYGAVIGNLADVEREGYEFTGWTDDEGRKVGTASTMPARDLAVMAGWAGFDGIGYAVEYYGKDLSGEYGLLKSEAYTGVTEQEVTAPVGLFPGYVWDEEAEGTVLTGIVAGDGSLVLKLFYDREVYTVKYVDGEDVSERQVTFGDKLGKVPAAEKDGFIFDGWYDGDVKAVEDLTVDRDMTFTVKWTKVSRPSSGGGSYKPEPVVIEDPETPLAGLELLTRDHIAYIQGFPDGNVGPEQEVTRAEVAMMFYRLMKPEALEIYQTSVSAFADTDTGAWYNTAVATLANAGILQGRGNGIFDPDAHITRAEFTVICARFDEANVGDVEIEFADVDKDAWYYNLVMQAASKGWVQGYGDDRFGPMDNITRAEAVTLINRMTGRAYKDSVDRTDGSMRVWPDNAKDSWYYIAIQEASNGHNFDFTTDNVEIWESLK